MTSSNRPRVAVFVGSALAAYGFPGGHPFGPTRMASFWHAAVSAGLDRAVEICTPVTAERQEIERFHLPRYVDRVQALSELGQGYFDQGDTPAFPHVYEATATVVGSTLEAVRRVIARDSRRAFVPIAGLHHASRDSAAGFCIFNDCGVAIETLRAVHGMQRIAYVDIDAHHGDGVYYGFDDDPDLLFADMHEDGRFLYPGTGAAEETGVGRAIGTKLNIPLPPNADDSVFMQAWSRVESYLRNGAPPNFIIFQCGADSVAGDPLAHLAFSPSAHAHAATRLCAIAEELCDGRLVALGGGGYNHANIAAAWTGVLRALIEAG